MAWKMPWTRLREAGIIGMNERNAMYIAQYNERRLYPLVDDKLRTKQLALAAGIAVPQLYAEFELQHDVQRLATTLQAYDRFVLKPAHGAGGDGIVVITGRSRDEYIRASGQRISSEALAHHVSNILSGMFSLGGLPDKAMLEYCVAFDPVFEPITFQGVPDIRTLVFRGVPVAAMLRLPTSASDGKANLHQGAVGAGIDLATGSTRGGVQFNRPVSHHPDTHQLLADFEIPGWPQVLELAARCYDLAQLGYLGVDIVLDRDLGPLVLELNARPGLSIQLANGRGLRPVFRQLTGYKTIPASATERVALGLKLVAATS